MHNITVSSSIAWLFIAVVESNSVLFKSCFWSPLRWFCIEMNKLGINHKCTKGVTPEQMAGCDYCLWSNFADCANHPKSFPRPPPHTHLLSRAALHTASDYMTECRIMVRGWFSKWEVHNDSPLLVPLYPFPWYILVSIEKRPNGTRGYAWNGKPFAKK